MAWQEDMVESLRSAKNGDKTLVIKQYEQITGKSSVQLYRIARQHGYSPKRKTRADKGEYALTPMQIKFVAGLLHTTSREKKGVIMPVKEALDIAEQDGIIPPGCVSVARMQTILREQGLSKKILKEQKRYQPMRSLYPNHVHFMDVSVCIQYYLKDKKLRIEREDKFYKNKFENFVKIKRKIYRYVLTDHFSHAIFLKYYIAEGETISNLWDFLVSAWEEKSNINKYPFRGVPFYMMMDKGASNVSHAIKKFLRKLDVRFLEGLPHNAKRQGSVERAQNFVEAYFESKLRLQPVSGIEELNAHALDWCAYVNASGKFRHSRHGMPRTECWMKIRKEQLRECPDRKILQELFTCDARERKVYGDYSIRFEGEQYRVKHIEGLIPNVSKVQAYKKPFSWPEIMVEFEGKEYLVKPIQTTDGGFAADAAVIGEEFKAMPESPTEKEIKVIENLAYGEDTKKDAVPFGGLPVFGGQAHRIKKDYMPRRATPATITKDDIDDRRVSMFDLFRDLSRFGVVSPELNKAVRLAYGDSITLADRDKLVQAQEQGCLSVDNNGDLIFTRREDDSLTAAFY